MIIKFLLGIFAVILGTIGITLVLSSENALVFKPKGIVAQQELDLIITNILLMLSIIIPTFLLLFIVIWRYCIRNKDAVYDPDHTFGWKGEALMWGVPALVVAVMSVITWDATHKLNPYTPLESDKEPLLIQVVAMDWKWLFIYPDQGIATLNSFHIPEKTPIHLRLAADGSPMNSFWIPQLSGQIYSMTGMSTQLYLMADGPGKYTGRAVEINGEGYAGMTFNAISTTQKEFEEWVTQVKKSPNSLTQEYYNELVKPSVNQSITYFSQVENNLYENLIHKYMYPTKTVLWKSSFSEN
jgi:cytochrome o ubiquinol oxidase subunit 2